MNSAIPESCEHESCGFNQRPEYCIEPLNDKRELGRYLADEIDTLLHEGAQYSHEHIDHQSVAEMQTTTRKLEFFSGTSHDWLYPAQGSRHARTWVEKHIIEIERMISSAEEVYSLTLWEQNLDTYDEQLLSLYTLYFNVDESEYSGRVTFDEYVLLDGRPELRSRSVKDREMSYYDYEQLFDLLWRVNQVHGLEGVSNARSEEWLDR